MIIPSLEFCPQSSAHEGIEIIEFDAFYKRLPYLDHNPALPHRVQFYCLLYIAHGEGSHFIDFKHYPYQAGSYVFINPHQVQAFDLKNRPQGKMVFFTHAFIDAIRVRIRMPIFTTNLMPAYSPVFTAPPPLKETSEILFSEIDKEMTSPDGDNLTIQLLFSTLLLKLSRKRPNDYDQKISLQHETKFSQFITLIENKYTETRDASVYASMMGMTYKSLHHICKLASNQTPKQLIDAHTVLEAKRRLVVERVQVQQLAYDLGFGEATNFTKYFKKQTLTTPSQFKENFKG